MAVPPILGRLPAPQTPLGTPLAGKQPGEQAEAAHGLDQLSVHVAGLAGLGDRPQLPGRDLADHGAEGLLLVGQRKRGHQAPPGCRRAAAVTGPLPGASGRARCAVSRT